MSIRKIYGISKSLLVKVRNDGKNWKMFAAIEKFTEQGQRRHNILSITDIVQHFYKGNFHKAFASLLGY